MVKNFLLSSTPAIYIYPPHFASFSEISSAIDQLDFKVELYLNKSNGTSNPFMFSWFTGFCIVLLSGLKRSRYLWLCYCLRPWQKNLQPYFQAREETHLLESCRTLSGVDMISKKIFKFCWARKILENHLSTSITCRWHTGPKQAAVQNHETTMAAILRRISARALLWKIVRPCHINSWNLQLLKGSW